MFVVSSPARHLLLLGDLVLDLGLLVEFVEGVDYDGDGEGDDQDSTDGAGCSTQFTKPGSETVRIKFYKINKLSQEGLPGCDVSISNRCHGDDGPVESGGHGDELVWVGVLLHHECQTREDQHPHDDHQPQESQLLVRILESGSQCLETSDVATKSEYSEDPHDPEHLGHPPHLVLVLPRALHVGQRQRHEVWDDTKQIYHIHTLLDEVPLLG